MFPDRIEKFHHAYLVEGGMGIASELSKKISNTKSEYGVVDVHAYHYHTLDRKSAENFRSTQSRLHARPVFYIVVAGAYTSDAIETLLKTVEEPSKNTYYIFVFGELGGVPSTFLSRCNLIAYNQIHAEAVTESIIDPKQFLNGTVYERVRSVQAYLDAKDETGEVREYMFGLLRELELVASNQSDMNSRRIIFDAILKTKKAMANQAVPIRLALEYLAVALP